MHIEHFHQVLVPQVSDPTSSSHRRKSRNTTKIKTTRSITLSIHYLVQETYCSKHPKHQSPNSLTLPLPFNGLSVSPAIMSFSKSSLGPSRMFYPPFQMIGKSLLLHKQIERKNTQNFACVFEYRGLHHPNCNIRYRCCYLFYRFVLQGKPAIQTHFNLHDWQTIIDQLKVCLQPELTCEWVNSAHTDNMITGSDCNPSGVAGSTGLQWIQR